jgi:hypothetical protein
VVPAEYAAAVVADERERLFFPAEFTVQSFITPEEIAIPAFQFLFNLVPVDG